MLGSVHAHSDIRKEKEKEKERDVCRSWRRGGGGRQGRCRKKIEGCDAVGVRNGLSVLILPNICKGEGEGEGEGSTDWIKAIV